jgi:hypothetical protein
MRRGGGGIAPAGRSVERFGCSTSVSVGWTSRMGMGAFAIGGGVGTAAGERGSLACAAFTNVGAAGVALDGADRRRVSAPGGATFL